MLVHTSGQTTAHEADRAIIEQIARDLSDSASNGYADLVSLLHATAQALYSDADPNRITEYVLLNASRTVLVVLNNKRDRVAAGDNPTEPTSPFTIIVGGNIVSRGVTFPNLLSMFFTRNVRSKLQQDTYIQRARMFGDRNDYLAHFELTIPGQLYSDWHRCFLFHKLALETVKTGSGSPVWIGDGRVAVVSDASIDKATVIPNKGEMSFGMFDYSADLDALVLKDQTSISTLKELHDKIGNGALPRLHRGYDGGRFGWSGDTYGKFDSQLREVGQQDIHLTRQRFPGKASTRGGKISERCSSRQNSIQRRGSREALL